MGITVNGKVIEYKARKTVSKINGDKYPKARPGNGEKGYSIPHDSEDGFDVKTYNGGRQEIIASIIRSSMDGNIVAVIIGRVDMNLCRWKWFKTLPTDKIMEVKDDGYQAVELKVDPTKPGIITLDFYSQITSACATFNFKSLTGEEITV
jgi:hypothetical protein